MQEGGGEVLLGDGGTRDWLWLLLRLVIIKLELSVVLDHVILGESNAEAKVSLNPEMNSSLVDTLLVVAHFLPHLVLFVPLLLGLVHHVSEDAQLLLTDVPTADLRGDLLDVTVLQILELQLLQQVEDGHLVEGEAVLPHPLVYHFELDSFAAFVRLQQEFDHSWSHPNILCSEGILHSFQLVSLNVKLDYFGH